MTCERGPGLEEKFGRLVREFQGELRTITILPSEHEQVWRSEISFVPRSTFSAAEILIALSRCGEVNVITG
ncbi:MAG TPA: hypothetical protein VMM36_02260 [Opitutaceae bacterium]|nr:hypothetical protein [Opitutaceae bacterium]